MRTEFDDSRVDGLQWITKFSQLSKNQEISAAWGALHSTLTDVIIGASNVSKFADKDRQNQLHRAFEGLTKTVSLMERVQTKGVPKWVLRR